MKEIAQNIHIDHFGGSRSGSFFLTHWHKDHLSGLTHSWCKGPLYTSIDTRNILAHTRPFSIKYIIALPPFIRTNFAENNFVTLYPANHMIGSAMFYFEINGKNIMYTGDYRYHPSMRFPEGERIDSLYLDKTFQRIKGHMLPLRKSVGLAETWMRAMAKKSLEVVYVGYFHLGTCELLYAWHRAFGRKYSLERQFLTEEEFNIAQGMYGGDMWWQKGEVPSKPHILVTPVFRRKADNPIRKPILMASARWGTQNNLTFINQVASDGDGTFRINFTNHSDSYDNQALIDRLAPVNIHFL